jgi:hypothetical protein
MVHQPGFAVDPLSTARDPKVRALSAQGLVRRRVRLRAHNDGPGREAVAISAGAEVVVRIIDPVDSFRRFESHPMGSKPSGRT